MKWWRIFFGGLFLVVCLFFTSAVYADTIYTVQFGDTLWSISRRFNLTPGDIKAVNPKIVDINLIYGGDVLIIPGVAQPTNGQSGTGNAVPGTHVVVAGDNLFRLSRRYNTTVDAFVAANRETIRDSHWIYIGDTLRIPGYIGGLIPPVEQDDTLTKPVLDSAGNYIVQPGDHLLSIARNFNTDINTLRRLNPDIHYEDLIFVGQVIKMPSKGGQPTNKIVNFDGLEVGGETYSLAHGQRMTEMGMRWVKYQVGWQAAMNPADVIPLVQQGHAAKFKVLLTITGAYEYPSPGSLNHAAYIEFVRGVAGLGQNAPDAIEIWHEQNIDLSWPRDEISGANYVRLLLAPSYSAIKSVNDNVMVISGAPSPTGMHDLKTVWADDYYIGEMAAAGASAYADCIGVHYNAGATSPNSLAGHKGGSHYSWYFVPMLRMYYDTFAQALPLCFTQIGYLSPETFPSVPGDYDWSAGTKVDQQAAWLVESITLTLAENRPVKMMIIYNIDYTDYQVLGDPDAGYAIFRPNGSCPACDALSRVIPRG